MRTIYGRRVEDTGSLFQLMCAIDSIGESHNSLSKKLTALLGREINTYGPTRKGWSDLADLIKEIRLARIGVKS